ncbi:hypothetical protein BKA93DRAFT_542160 [Sparassis latifolia]
MSLLRLDVDLRTWICVCKQWLRRCHYHLSRRIYVSSHEVFEAFVRKCKFASFADSLKLVCFLCIEEHAIRLQRLGASATGSSRALFLLSRVSGTVQCRLGYVLPSSQYSAARLCTIHILSAAIFMNGRGQLRTAAGATVSLPSIWATSPTFRS